MTTQDDPFPNPLRRQYEHERQAENRNYAKGHSFEEWLDREREQRNIAERCQVCGGHHDEWLVFGGVKFIPCPNVPKGWLIPIQSLPKPRSLRSDAKQIIDVTS